MPVTLELIEDGHILRLMINQPWDMNDFVATFPQTTAYLDAATHTLHSVVNIEGATRDPRGVLRVRHQPAFKHPRGGYIAFCGAIPLARTLTETAMRLIRFKNYKFFHTEAEGMAFLRELIANEHNVEEPAK